MDNLRKNTQQYYDPDPIATYGLICATITVLTSVANLIMTIEFRRNQNQSQIRKIRSIVLYATEVAYGIAEDLRYFGSKCQPSQINFGDNRYFIWDLNEHDLHAMKRLFRKIVSSFNRLNDIQNQIGSLELPEIGDKWRFHSNSSSTELFRLLGAIESIEDLQSLYKQIDNRLMIYIVKLSELSDAINDKYNRD